LLLHQALLIFSWAPCLMANADFFSMMQGEHLARSLTQHFENALHQADEAAQFKHGRELFDICSSGWESTVAQMYGDKACCDAIQQARASIYGEDICAAGGFCDKNSGPTPVESACAKYMCKEPVKNYMKLSNDASNTKFMCAFCSPECKDSPMNPFRSRPNTGPPRKPTPAEMCRDKCMPVVLKSISDSGTPPKPSKGQDECPSPTPAGNSSSPSHSSSSSSPTYSNGAAQYDLMCTQNREGQYCLAVLSPDESSSRNDSPAPGSCEESPCNCKCDDPLVTKAKGAGCCAGTLPLMMGEQDANTSSCIKELFVECGISLVPCSKGMAGNVQIVKSSMKLKATTKVTKNAVSKPQAKEAMRKALSETITANCEKSEKKCSVSPSDITITEVEEVDGEVQVKYTIIQKGEGAAGTDISKSVQTLDDATLTQNIDSQSAALAPDLVGASAQASTQVLSVAVDGTGESDTGADPNSADTIVPFSSSCFFASFLGLSSILLGSFVL